MHAAGSRQDDLPRAMELCCSAQCTCRQADFGKRHVASCTNACLSDCSGFSYCDGDDDDRRASSFQSRPRWRRASYANDCILQRSVERYVIPVETEVVLPFDIPVQRTTVPRVLEGALRSNGQAKSRPATAAAMSKRKQQWQCISQPLLFRDECCSRSSWSEGGDGGSKAFWSDNQRRRAQRSATGASCLLIPGRRRASVRQRLRGVADVDVVQDQLYAASDGRALGRPQTVEIKMCSPDVTNRRFCQRGSTIVDEVVLFDDPMDHRLNRGSRRPSFPEIERLRRQTARRRRRHGSLGATTYSSSFGGVGSGIHTRRNEVANEEMARRARRRNRIRRQNEHKNRLFRSLWRYEQRARRRGSIKH